MATDKDDPDLSPTVMPGENDGQKDASTPSSSDANTPNTFSTEGQSTTQPPSDDEKFESPESSNITSTMDKTSIALFTEPDPETLHPDLDLNDRNTLTRLLALLQNGWVLSRGRGFRARTICLWCRGPTEHDTQILTHVGAAGTGCMNSWPAGCLMDWISQDLDILKKHKLDCPMCREQFCNFVTKKGADFKAYDGIHNNSAVLNAAWLRCVLFSPIFARKVALDNQKPLIFMKGTEATKLVFLGKDKRAFDTMQGLLDPREQENQQKWLMLTQSNPPTVSQLIENGLSVPQATAVAFTAAFVSNPDQRHEPLQMPPAYDLTWVIIDRGGNQFIMSPFFTDQANSVIRVPVGKNGGIIKDMTAVEFNDLARQNGGLRAAVEGFNLDKEGEIKSARVMAEAWLQRMVIQNKHNGVASRAFELYWRIHDALEVYIDISSQDEAIRGITDLEVGDEWEGDSGDNA